MKKYAIAISLSFLCEFAYCEATDMNDLMESLRDLTGRIEKVENENEKLANEVSALKEQIFKQKCEYEEKENRALIENLSGEEVAKKVHSLIETNEIDKARKIVEIFVNKNPEDIHCGMLLFYCGESYFVEKDYSNAALQYIKSYEKNSRGSKSANCLYKLALCFKFLNKIDESKASLQKIVKDHQGEYVQKAKLELQKINK